jgi:cation diffusion facilitator family transporter
VIQPAAATDALDAAVRAPLAGVVVNGALAAVKITTGILGNSYALVADGIESTSDILSSLIVWSGLRISLRPADELHPYGYGKAEALAGIAGSLALLLAAALIALQSVREILTPHHLPHWSTLVVLAAVVLTKETLARWVGKRGRQVGSTALESDAWHHRSDALTSLAAFIGISIGLLGGPGYEPADDWAALVACGVIAFTGVRLLRLSVRDILDRSPSREFEHKVRDIALQVPGVLAIDKCRIRKSGLMYLVDIHVQVAGDATVREGHSIGGRVRSALRSSSLRIADVLVHIEPH